MPLRLPKLFEYKLYHLNLDRFVEKVLQAFHQKRQVGDDNFTIWIMIWILCWKVHSMIYSPRHQASEP